MFKYWPFLVTSRSLLALTTLTVTLSSDNFPGNLGEMGDLRYCLNQMNQDLNTFPDDYEIVFAFPMTIQLNGMLPIINNSANPVNITIGNPGSIPTVTIDGNSGTYSGFFIPTGNVTIQNIILQNMTARGGNGGNGISGGGGGLGAGGAIYAPQTFLYGSNPSITLTNVLINECSAVGGNGGSYIGGLSTGDEGGGGGGGFGGNGGSITALGSTGGAGGGGFGGNGGDVTLSTSDPMGGAGSGGGGIGSRATLGMLTNLGNGGIDQDFGNDGNGYGLMVTAGAGAGGIPGGATAGGGGGGASLTVPGGGGGGSAGTDGSHPEGAIPPGASVLRSGGNGGDGGGGGGGGVVTTGSTNEIDGQPGTGGYGGGGGGGAGTGAYDTAYSVQGARGGFGGGGGGGGVNQSGSTPAEGGDSFGGGGGGGGPSNGLNALGGSDLAPLGGGAGGAGNNVVGSGFGGGGGGGGSGLGGAIFVDRGLNFTIQAIPGVPTTFNTLNTTVQAGFHGTGGGGGTDGMDGSAFGNSIFLCTGSSLTLNANDVNDLLTLGSEVSFTDDSIFGLGGTLVFASGNGTIVYEGMSDYQGSVIINNANLKVNGLISQAPISVCRNSGFSAQRGTLSGIGTLTGDVFVNSGVISPDTGATLSLGSLTLNPADLLNGTLGSLTHIEINSSGTSLVSISGPASLAGILEIDLDPSATPGIYTILNSSGITGTFDSIMFTGITPNYTLSYLPMGSPTFVQLDFLGYFPIIPSVSTSGLGGNNLITANYLNILAPNAAALGLTDQFTLLNSLSPDEYLAALDAISPSRNASSAFAAQNVLFMLAESLNSRFTKRRLAHHQSTNSSTAITALLEDQALVAANTSSNKPTATQSPRKTMHAPPPDTNSQFWVMGFGQFSNQHSQNQTPGFDFNGGGFLVAYDYGNRNEGCIGALAGYAHTSVDENHSMGNSHLNTGYLSAYGTKYISDFFVDASIWGVYMGVSNERNISFPGFSGTAKSSYHAGQFDIHLGAGYDFNRNSVTIEPFISVDWASEWDPNYKESGAAPYNMDIASRTARMFRLETGLNGYKTTTYGWGVFIAQAKLSYVYKKPHHGELIRASIINAPTSFGVEAFTATQNLISPAIELFWQSNWNGYGSVSYNGEFGSGYRSNQFYGKLGYSF